MQSGSNSFLQHELVRRGGEYLLKAVIVVALLYLLARYAPSISQVGIALSWTALSLISAVGIAYHFVIRKALRQFSLKGGGIFARFNSGRTFSLLIAFVLAAVLVAGLVLESPKWDTAEWAMIAAAVPVYFGVFAIMRKILAKQYEPQFQTSRATGASILITGVLLCTAYLAICANAPAVNYVSATDAFLGAKQPFEGSPSILLSEAGMYIALVDGLVAYGLSQVAGASPWAYLACKVAICGSAFFGVANLIGMCALKHDELELVFKPLEAAKHPGKQVPFAKRYLTIACVLPVLLVAGFLGADAWFAKVAQTEEYTAAQSFVRERAGVFACLIDGKYYDLTQVQDLMEEANLASQALAQEREEVLVPLINESFDRRVQNVDGYLDWYYSLTADYGRLVEYFAGTLESGMEEQLAQRINEGVDDSELMEQIDYYMQQSEMLEQEFEAKLAQYEITDVPEWLIVPAETLDAGFLSEPLAPSHQFLNTGQRLGLSMGSGAIAGVVSAKVTQKILAKPFFRKIVASLTEKLATKGLLAAGGTMVAPGVGTAIGIGVTVAADYLFLKADEAANREEYREEIVSAIEEQRAEMLALAQAPA